MTLNNLVPTSLMILSRLLSTTSAGLFKLVGRRFAASWIGRELERLLRYLLLYRNNRANVFDPYGIE